MRHKDKKKWQIVLRAIIAILLIIFGCLLIVFVIKDLLFIIMLIIGGASLLYKGLTGKL